MKLHITPQLYTKLRYIVENYQIEIGGYLIGEIRNKQVFLQDILIPSQQISGVHVDISAEAQLDLRRKYKDKVFKILGHFHSHHTMGAFWSGTDLNLMEETMEHKKFYVFIVGSTTGFLIRVSIRDPIQYDIENCDFFIDSLEFNNFRNSIDKLVDENVGKSQINSGNSDDNEESDDDTEEDRWSVQ